MSTIEARQTIAHHFVRGMPMDRSSILFAKESDLGAVCWTKIYRGLRMPIVRNLEVREIHKRILYPDPAI